MKTINYYDLIFFSLRSMLTLMLHTYVEEKRARVRQMWLRTDLDRSRRT